MLKQFGFCTLVAALLLSSCKPEEIDPGMMTSDQAYISFTNASPSGRPLNLFVDGTRVNQNGAVATNGTFFGTYFGVAPGSRTIAARDTNSTTSIEYVSSSQSFDAGKSYSAFVYDTLSGGKLRALVLTTDRTPLAFEKAGVRFLNLVPNSQPVDLWLFRQVSSTVTDSVKVFSSVSYVGPTPNTANLSAFSQVPAAAYTVRLRPVGSVTNLATLAVSLYDTRLYTIVARGLVGGSGAAALGLTAVAQ